MVSISLDASFAAVDGWPFSKGGRDVISLSLDSADATIGLGGHIFDGRLVPRIIISRCVVQYNFHDGRLDVEVLLCDELVNELFSVC